MRALTLFATICVSGCFSPEHGTDELEPGQEPGSLFGIDASNTTGGDAGMCPGATAMASLHIRIRTTAVGGRYAPRNIGAIWIEDANGKFVKTVERWAKTRVGYLTKWRAASNSNVVDAITSATLASHMTHDRMWNLVGLDGCKVTPGNYRVVVEETDSNTTGPLLQIPFTVSSTPMTATPTETATFHDLLLELK